MERQSKRRPKQLDGPPLPLHVAHLWLWFLDLARARGSNGFGANPISWLDLRAWSDLTGHTPRPAEIDAILEIDQLWLASQAPPPKSPPPRKK